MQEAEYNPLVINRFDMLPGESQAQVIEELFNTSLQVTSQRDSEGEKEAFNAIQEKIYPLLYQWLN